ncbi:MAG: SDR family NAD(P)-dependent oxidoreductase [Thiovulaceae bacterium]|nr:SDR family NAD(P)-dependent oxidoreductase [Sulfurimonadaceae bacterium]
MNIVITGASSGIGAGLARKYATANNHLFLLARREDRLSSLKTELEALGATVSTYTVDVTDFTVMQNIALELSQKSLDLIILNAGISTGHSGDVTPFELAKKVYETNLLSLHAFLEPLIPALKVQKQGHIVFISSLASLLTMPTSLVYGSSKRAMNAYAEGLRFMLHPFNIDVTTIKPGFIVTELTDKNDFTMPFLLSLEKGVERISNAIKKKKKIYAFPLRFVLIIKLLNLLPLFFRQHIITSQSFNKEA